MHHSQACIHSASHIPCRWTIVVLCFIAFMLCNMDRVNMSVAILPMSQQYGWSSATVGLVQSSFFWGYLLTQVSQQSVERMHFTVLCGHGRLSL